MAKLESERIDVTLPGEPHGVGHINPYHLIIDEVTDIFLDMGYEVCEGRDVETDKFNFELLNVPKDHPSRDMQDTFYFGDDYLLRTQTSAAQAHKMSEMAEKKPIRMIAPGKAYRRDDDDMTHSHQFAQIEGLVVDKGISIAHLKATLELFAKKMFGQKREIRLRSSYFPFTEPSVEVDVSCFNCGGKGCAMCKGTGWIEILGAGMVNPASSKPAAMTRRSTAVSPLASASNASPCSVMASMTSAVSIRTISVSSRITRLSKEDQP